MTIGAVISVMDDVELLAKNIQHHQNIGVDYFLICDWGSTDQSLSQIDEMANNERI